MDQLTLTPDELLTTTRAVRKRLDLDRPVELDVIKECLDVATQAPTGGNTQGWHFVVVTDVDKRAGLAELYRRGWKIYRQSPGSVFDLFAKEPEGARKRQLGRVAESADYLAENLHRVPVHVVPCTGGRVDQIAGDFAGVGLASIYGSILGTAWTTCHLMYEKEAAEILAIPYDQVSQVALIATAYSLGTDFKPSLRKPIDEVLHIDQW